LRRGFLFLLPCITFKGIVGLELKSRGLNVALNVFKDEEYFDAMAEIMVTNPGTEEDARVCITDDGHVSWARDYVTEAMTTTREPEFREWIDDPAKVADAVVATITQAMSHLHQPA